ncbi:MAG: ASPIC/UnbV domain-containing protein, partial [Pirellulales bacterium]
MTDQWVRARADLSRMIKEGRSFSGRERNCCFLNLGDRRFATVSAVTGLDFPDDGRAIAVVDWDHDGDLDLWISNRNAPRLRLMRNESTAANHWLSLRLVGDGKKTNRDAIGARVEVSLAEPTAGRSVATLRAGEGFLAQSSKWLHFGLGAASKLDKITVDWPGGAAELFSGVEVDGRYVLTQGSGRPRQVREEPRTLVLTPSTARLPTPSSRARIPLAVRLPLPRETYLRFDGTRQTLTRHNDHALLLNLWSPSCRPCVAELKEMAGHERQLRDAGVEVVALAVDALDAQQAKTTAAEELMQRLKFPFLAGRAEAGLVEDLQRLHDDLILMRKPLPIPCSFLIDRRGRLAVIYKGPVDVAQIVHDSRIDPHGYRERWEVAACLPGRVIDLPHVAEIARQGEIRTRYRVAISLQDDGRIGDAATGFEALIEADPDCAEAHRQLAAALLESGDSDR